MNNNNHLAQKLIKKYDSLSISQIQQDIEKIVQSHLDIYKELLNKAQ